MGNEIVFEKFRGNVTMHFTGNVARYKGPFPDSLNRVVENGELFMRDGSAYSGGLKVVIKDNKYHFELQGKGNLMTVHEYFDLYFSGNFNNGEFTGRVMPEEKVDNYPIEEPEFWLKNVKIEQMDETAYEHVKQKFEQRIARDNPGSGW